MNEELSGRYRIKEITYKNGHKKYVAQEAKKFLFFKWWNDFYTHVWDYGYAKVKFMCVGRTFDECKAQLLTCLKEQERKANAKIVSSTKLVEL